MTLYLLLSHLWLLFLFTAGASSALDPRRSSNFSLVGSHKITLSSLGQSKFLLDKVRALRKTFIIRVCVYVCVLHRGGVCGDVTVPSLCLSPVFFPSQMKFEGKIRQLLGDEFQDKVSRRLLFTLCSFCLGVWCVLWAVCCVIDVKYNQRIWRLETYISTFG